MLAGGLIALAGVGVAGFQSWEQWYPELVGGCTGAEPGLIEQLVEWLGVRWPRLFMATGFCESKELVILGLSLANWSFLAYAGFTAMASLIFALSLNFQKGNRIMKDIKVLGTGCANCRNTIKLIEEVAAEKGVEISLSKVEQLPEIMKYGVMSTPGVVVDGKVVHAGGIPDRSKIATWL